MSIVKTENLAYDYLKYTDDESEPVPQRAVDGVSIDVAQGAFVAVLGHNGSGKSTLAKHINALLMPTEGSIWIDGQDTKEEPDLWKVRQKAGMVFQNPDNQIIAASVEEDVAFGPENIGTPREEIWQRVEEALTKVGMLSYRQMSPNRLSGGQKQRVAIAGIVAMRPQCIVLDEPTAMLDPSGRKEVIAVLHELNKEEGVTIILITHYMEEVVGADRIFVMDRGKLVMSGTPREVFSRVEELQEMQLDVPQITLLAYELKKEGLPVSDGVLEADELAAQIASSFIETSPGRPVYAENVRPPESDAAPAPQDGTSAAEAAAEECGAELEQLVLQNVSYVYSPKTSYEVRALNDISLSVKKGQFIAIIGHTGSGKSTLIQMFNGLLKPSEGKIFFEGQDIYGEGYVLKDLRTQVGLVFQYPENQLFEEDVLSDVCFGPKNQGLTEEEAKARAGEALLSVGIREKHFAESPFELSGGQKRRVAIAGVLAMHPKVLILDEPTAGLDPKGRDAILMEAEKLCREDGITVILVSHSMEDVARYAERLIVIDAGEIQFDGTPKEVFSHTEELEEMGLSAPQMTYLVRALAERGVFADPGATTIREAKASILSLYRKKDA